MCSAINVSHVAAACLFRARKLKGRSVGPEVDSQVSAFSLGKKKSSLVKKGRMLSQHRHSHYIHISNLPSLIMPSFSKSQHLKIAIVGAVPASLTLANLPEKFDTIFGALTELRT